MDSPISPSRAIAKMAVSLRLSDVPAPVITQSLYTRFRSRQSESFGEKVLAALRNEFGGHAVKSK